MLLGRAQESAVIDQLLENARKGGSGVIVIKGEAGIGKTALLDHATQLVSGMRVLRVSGVESEAEIPFGALHLLLHGELALIDSLPEVQGAALRAALGEAPVRAEDRLLVGLAVLTLLSDLAEQTPLLVLLDDAQWFDQPSSSALSFAARRLSHEGIVMILAVRDGDGAHAADGLPELRLARLDDTDAARFLTERRPDLPADARRGSSRRQRATPWHCLSSPARSPDPSTAYRQPMHLRSAARYNGGSRIRSRGCPGPPKACCWWPQPTTPATWSGFSWRPAPFRQPPTISNRRSGQASLR